MSRCKTVSDCPLPDTTAIAAASPAVAVAGIATLNPSAAAAKACGPTTLPSVSDVDAFPFASVDTVAEPTLPPVGAAKFTATPGTPTPSLAVTRTTAGCPSSAPTRPLWPPPLTNTIPAGGRTIVATALSLMLFGVVAVTVTVPRLPVGVSVPVFEIVAIVGSDVVQLMGTCATGALFASNAVTLKNATAGGVTCGVFGETTIRATLAPGPV